MFKGHTMTRKETYFVALVLLPLLATAQPAPSDAELAADQKLLKREEAKLGAASLTSARASSAIRIEAGTANSAVSIKISPTSGDGIGSSSKFSLIASAPLAKGATDATLVTRQGLNSGTTLTAVLAGASLGGTRVAKKETLDLCDPGKKLHNAYLSIKGNEPDKFLCDTGTMSSLALQGKITEEEYMDFHASFFGPDAGVHGWSVALTGGYRDSAYFDASTLVQSKRRQSMGGLSAGYSYMPIKATQLLAAALSVQAVVKDAKSSTACLQNPGGSSALLTCASGAIGPPKRQNTQVLDLEWRRKVADRYAFSLQLSHDFKEKVTTATLPVYLIGNKTDPLTGGVSLGWSSDDRKLSIGVFVGKAFTLDQ
jgi:hypothetical protein